MDERVSLQDLIDLLSKKQSITKKEAETFLRELIAVISENIENNEPVKIKDFGVFKLVLVSARKSVNVNTGEAIEIPAHYKLSFTPDKSLKEAINRPFAHFESVVLEDGVTFDNVEKEEQTEELTEQDETIDAEDETYEVIEQLAETNEPVEHEKETISEESIQEVTSQEETIEQEDNIKEEVQDVPVAIVEQEEITEEPTPIQPTDPIERIESRDEETEPEFDNEYYNDEGSSKKKWLIIGLIVLAVLAGVGFYFKDQIIDKVYDNERTLMIQEKEAMLLQRLKMLEDSIALAKQAQDSIQTTDSIQANNITEEKKDIEAAKNTKPERDINKPLGTVTIEYGHTLRNIALKYYGHKSFWVYIYEENKGTIKNPNQIPINTKLVLPAPAKYGIDAKNPAAVEKAKKAESKLIREMGL